MPVRRDILKEIVAEHAATATTAEWIDLVDALMAGRSHEEKTMASYLLGYCGVEVRGAVAFKQLEIWLDGLHGWAEVDSLCQSIFTAPELLDDWSEWKKFLNKLSKDKNINKRRASIVFLTMPARKSDDVRIHAQSLEMVELLKSETDILITKAISWILRNLSERDIDLVKGYLETNHNTLPKIAVRETIRKIKTGTKNG